MGSYLSNTAKSETYGVCIEHEKSHCSAEWILEFRNWYLLRPRDLLGQRAKALQKPVGPFINGLQNDAAAHSSHRYLSLPLWKSTFRRKAHGLTTTVLEQFSACRFHTLSIYLRRYISSRPMQERLDSD